MEKLRFIFTACAVAGGALFLIRLCIQMFGFSSDAPDDVHDAGHSSDADASFRVLSLLGITAFLMMFGLAGRAMLGSRPDSAPLAVAVALLAGGGCLWLMAALFRGMRKMQSDGTTNLANAVGQEGSVYLSIPPPDAGKIQVAFQNRLAVVDARSADGSPIPTGARVKVVRVVDGNVLEVQPAHNTQE